jgi:hypothetical protein
MQTLLMLELFSGSKSMAGVFKEHGWNTFTVDFDAKLKPDLVADISKLISDDILNNFGHPDVIWSSPPCQCFCTPGLWKYRPDGVDSQDRLKAIELHKHAIQLIKDLTPTYYFIENPRGTLRHQRFMKVYPRYTITYCQYGFEYMKPTDIWTNHPAPRFKPACDYGDTCHTHVPHEGRENGVRLRIGVDHGMKDGFERSSIPKPLCEHIVKICDKNYTPPMAGQLGLIEFEKIMV